MDKIRYFHTIRKLKAAADRPGYEGERQAAVAAIARLQEKYGHLIKHRFRRLKEDQRCYRCDHHPIPYFRRYGPTFWQRLCNDCILEMKDRLGFDLAWNDKYGYVAHFGDGSEQDPCFCDFCKVIYHNVIPFHDHKPMTRTQIEQK